MTAATSISVVILAQAPALDELSIVGYGAVLGGLVGGAGARARHLPPDQVSRHTLDGSFTGGIFMFLLWLGAVVTPYLR